jgi:hypothetical protein
MVYAAINPLIKVANGSGASFANGKRYNSTATFQAIYSHASHLITVRNDTIDRLNATKRSLPTPSIESTIDTAAVDNECFDKLGYYQHGWAIKQQRQHTGLSTYISGCID